MIEWIVVHSFSSYHVLSEFVAFRAEMRRAFAALASSPIQVCATIRHSPVSARPMVIHRSSVSLCASSKVVTASGSRKTVEASVKETPCFRMFTSAFIGSHSISRLKPLTAEVYVESRIVVK